MQTLLDYIEAGESIDDFLTEFTSVSPGQFVAFLEQAEDCLVAAAALSRRFEKPIAPTLWPQCSASTTDPLAATDSTELAVRLASRNSN